MNPPNNRSPRRSAAWIPLAAGSVTALMGLIGLAGWHAQELALIRISPAIVGVSYQTALGFLLCGTALALLSRRRSYVAFLSFVASVIALLTLMQYAVDFDLRIDRFARVGDETLDPGRMAPDAALALLLVTVTLALLNSAPRRRWPGGFAGLVGAVVIALGMTAVLGYIAAVATVYGWGPLTRMSIQTAVGFTVLGGGLMVAAWQRDTLESGVLPNWAPLPIVVIVLTISVGVWNALEARTDLKIQRMVYSAARSYGDMLEMHMDARIRSLDRMARRWSVRGDMPREEWEIDALLHFEQLPGFQALEWVDESFRVRWIVPLDGNRQAQDLDMGFETRRRQALEQARDERAIRVSRVVNLVQGGKGFLVDVPIFTADDTFHGFIVGVFRVGELLDTCLANVGTSCALTLYDRDEIVYQRGRRPPHGTPWSHRSVLDLHGTSWRMQVQPTPATLHDMQTARPLIVLLCGMVVAVMLGITVHFMRINRLRTVELQRVNRQLETEIAERGNVAAELRRLAGDLESRVESRTGELKRSQIAALNMMEDAHEARSTAEAAETAQGRLIEELEAKNAEMEQFAYTVSHDLKSPLITIQGFLGLLEKDFIEKDPERLHGDLEQIRFAAEKMHRLLDELLELSRVGRLVDRPVAVPLNDIAAEALDLVAGRITDAQVRVAVEENMPSVMVDRARLVQVMQNLVENSVKFMGDQDAPQVDIGALTENGEVICSITDNGVGIDPRYHEKIFGLFERLETYGEGTGIGLALVKRIVEVHGGRVWVESQGEDFGATFRFALACLGESSGGRAKPNQTDLIDV